MYVLIKTSPDGDSYGVFMSKENAINAFNVATESNLYNGVYLLNASENAEFGFGAHSYVFGADEIKRWERDLDSGEGFLSGICGACGGDASECDGC